MQSHEWIRAMDGRVFKVDACSHGDDHFFPGPCDIAWDLAGSIVEWDLGDDAAEVLTASYERRSGDNPRNRLPYFLMAYIVFRLSYCKMALLSSPGGAEERMLKRYYEAYRRRLMRVTKGNMAAASMRSHS
jgi:hypothetical protein